MSYNYHYLYVESSKPPGTAVFHVLRQSMAELTTTALYFDGSFLRIAAKSWWNAIYFAPRRTRHAGLISTKASLRAEGAVE